jgi:hypothetical protein
MTELPKTLATEAERTQADAFANRMLGVKTAYSVPGFIKNGKFVPVEAPCDPLAAHGDDTGLAVASAVMMSIDCPLVKFS